MYFETLFGNSGVAGGTIVFCAKAGHGFRRVGMVGIGSEGWIERANEIAAKTTDCYLKFNVFDGEAIRSRSRNAIGSRDELIEVVCFAVDVDVSAKDSKYATQAEALAALEALPVPPTMIVGSNGHDGGLHAYWCLETPVVGETIHDAQAIAKRWYEHLNSVIPVDSTFSLERILRPVGSPRDNGNHVVLIGGSGERHELWELSLPGWEVHLQGSADCHAALTVRAEGDTDTDRYVREKLGLLEVEDVLAEFGWDDLGGGFWIRPEGTSGSKSGEVYVREDGRKGFTLKTPVVRARKSGKDVKLGEIAWYGVGRLWGLLEYGDDWTGRDREVSEGLYGPGAEFSVLGGPTNQLMVQVLGSGAPGVPRQRKSTPAQYRDAREMAAMYGVPTATVVQGLTDSEGIRLHRELSPGCTKTDQEIRDEIVLAEKRHIRGIDVGTNNRRAVSSATRLATGVLANGFGWDWDQEDRVELRYWRGDFYRFDGRIYVKQDDLDFRARVRGLVEGLHNEIGKDLLLAYQQELRDWLINGQRGPEPKLKPTPDTTCKAADEVAEVIATKVILPTDAEPALWVHDPDRCTEDLFAFENGLLEYGELTPHDPRLFKTDLLPFDFDAGARAPMWLTFLDQVFDGDRESIELLQEWMGLVLTQDVSMDKMLWLIGPSRSGKSTIMGIMNAIVGEANTTPIDLQELKAGFSMIDLVGKNLAVVSDARSGSKSDIQEAVVGKLLAVSGGDAVRIDRKNKTAWTGRLKCKFVIVANKPLALADSASALAARTLMLVTKQSFIDREDTDLEEKLRTELPGIFNWAKAGLDRLRLRGKFVQPASSQEMIRQAEALADPIKSFVSERCELVDMPMIGKQVNLVKSRDVLWVYKTKLYRNYVDWCAEVGQHPRSMAIFFRDLYSSTSGKVEVRKIEDPDDPTKRVRVCLGVICKAAEEDFD